MKLYRDLTEGETLQAGDLYRLRNSDMDWCEHTEEQAAEMPDATVGIIGRDDLEWRRPVDAVPQEQYDKVSLQLAQERIEHGRTAHGRDTLRAELDAARKAVDQAEWRGDAYRRSLMDRVAGLQSQPSLQRVTAEAMAEIEQRDTARIAVLTNDIAAEYEWKAAEGWRVMDKKFWRPRNGWFIDLSTLTEHK
jgi:hypothetical protein